MKRVEVTSLDRIGLVGEITNVIRRLNGNIISHSANVAADGKNALISYFTADVDLGDESGRDTLSRKLRRIRNVRQVKISDIRGDINE